MPTKLVIFTAAKSILQFYLDSIKNITLIGSGNVATQLGKALFDRRLSVNQVFSKQLENAVSLANKIDAVAINKLFELNNESDLYIICIKDDAIASTIKEISFKNKFVVHTSGSVPMNVLSEFNNFGIFYPLQTFSKDQGVDFSTIPICIEANTTANEETLINLGKTLSNNVQIVNSEQRKALHLAAVFACNFSNNMYAIADDILTKNGMDLSLLKPLIKETANKIENSNPKDVQTGPAKRNDQEVIINQLEMLADVKDYQDIYRLITENIIKNK